MDTNRAKDQQQIFSDMHRELRIWNPKIPESPDRLDPILKVLMQLYAHELARVDQRVSDLWERATNAVMRSLNPECRRWPVPAYTVMRCEVADPVAQIDCHTRFFYREEREGGQTFFFSPTRTTSLLQAEVKHIYLQSNDRVIDLSPSETDPAGHTTSELLTANMEPNQIIIGLAFDGRPSELADAIAFLSGPNTALRQLRWGHWYPSATSGQFYDDSGFCPGLVCSIDDVVTSDNAEDWGGLRTGQSLFGQMEDNFVKIPRTFAQTWEKGPLSPELAAQLRADQITEPEEALYWIRIDLPPGGDKQRLPGLAGIHFNTCVVVNHNELTLFKHTGGNQLLEIAIPEPIDSILQISTVEDSSGRNYLPRHRLHTNLEAGTYVLEERDDRISLWFDFSSTGKLPPDSIKVTYAVTGGVDANGIGKAKINELYESHPGISGGENLIPTSGAIPARTESQVVDEVASRLRDRDRALTFEAIARWTTSFDPRIQSAACRNGIERTTTGVRRCIVVSLTLDIEKFCSEDEIDLLSTRLTTFLKSRAPVNTHFQMKTGDR